MAAARTPTVKATPKPWTRTTHHPIIRISPEPILADQEIFYHGSSEEDSEGTRAHKRIKREQFAQDYLEHGYVPILTAALKGPFDDDWNNPWARKRRKITPREEVIDLRTTAWSVDRSSPTPTSRTRRIDGRTRSLSTTPRSHSTRQPVFDVTPASAARRYASNLEVTPSKKLCDQPTPQRTPQRDSPLRRRRERGTGQRTRRKDPHTPDRWRRPSKVTPSNSASGLKGAAPVLELNQRQVTDEIRRSSSNTADGTSKNVQNVCDERRLSREQSELLLACADYLKTRNQDPLKALLEDDASSETEDNVFEAKILPKWYDQADKSRPSKMRWEYIQPDLAEDRFIVYDGYPILTNDGRVDEFVDADLQEIWMVLYNGLDRAYKFISNRGLLGSTRQNDLRCKALLQVTETWHKVRDVKDLRHRLRNEAIGSTSWLEACAKLLLAQAGAENLAVPGHDIPLGEFMKQQIVVDREPLDQDSVQQAGVIHSADGSTHDDASNDGDIEMIDDGESDDGEVLLENNAEHLQAEAIRAKEAKGEEENQEDDAQVHDGSRSPAIAEDEEMKDVSDQDLEPEVEQVSGEEDQDNPHQSDAATPDQEIEEVNFQHEDMLHQHDRTAINGERNAQDSSALSDHPSLDDEELSSDEPAAETEMRQQDRLPTTTTSETESQQSRTGPKIDKAQAPQQQQVITVTHIEKQQVSQQNNGVKPTPKSQEVIELGSDSDSEVISVVKKSTIITEHGVPDGPSKDTADIPHQTEEPKVARFSNHLEHIYRRVLRKTSRPSILGRSPAESDALGHNCSVQADTVRLTTHSTLSSGIAPTSPNANTNLSTNGTQAEAQHVSQLQSVSSSIAHLATEPPLLKWASTTEDEQTSRKDSPNYSTATVSRTSKVVSFSNGYDTSPILGGPVGQSTSFFQHPLSDLRSSPEELHHSRISSQHAVVANGSAIQSSNYESAVSTRSISPEMLRQRKNQSIEKDSASDMGAAADAQLPLEPHITDEEEWDALDDATAYLSNWTAEKQSFLKSN